MSESRDIIQRILSMVMSVHPAMSEEQAQKIENEIRREYGGEQLTIAKRAPILRAAREKVRQQIGIKSVDQLKTEHGVSRRTLYRWLERK